MGNPTPVVFGWLRASHRTIDPNPYPDSFHLPVPVPSHKRSDRKEVRNGEIYDLQIELWPTNVVVERGERLVVEISPKDPVGADQFACYDPIDRLVSQIKTTFWDDSKTDGCQGMKKLCVERITSILAKTTKAMSSCQLYRYGFNNRLSRPQIFHFQFVRAPTRVNESSEILDMIIEISRVASSSSLLYKYMLEFA